MNLGFTVTFFVNLTIRDILRPKATTEKVALAIKWKSYPVDLQVPSENFISGFLLAQF